MRLVQWWTDRYQIVSLSGRVWTRAMVRDLTRARGRAMHLPVGAVAVDSVLGDDAFMIRLRGTIPARVAALVHDEARLRMRLDDPLREG